MEFIGNYDGMEVYKVKRGQSVGTNTKCLVVTQDGDIYLGGVNIGLLDPRTYKILRYDKDIYKRHMAEQKRRETKVPVSKSVAETADLSADGTPLGSDEFFARIALDIEEMLRGEMDLSCEYAVG